jgi:AraC-like DNA-binding protein
MRYSRYLPCCAAGVHQHDEARIVLLIGGAFSSDYGRRTIPIEVGGALYRPRGEDHADRYEASTDCLTLLLPDDGSLRRVSEPVVVRHAALARATRVLRAETEANDAASELVAEGIAILVSTLVLGRAPLTERGAPRWIGSVRERLDNAYDAPPSLAELARGVDRDPAYVAATFRRSYGVSAGAYVRRLKLWQARDRIDGDPSSNLSEVAQDCGFADQSHFTRHFRRLFGITPGAYRGRRGPDQRP